MNQRIARIIGTDFRISGRHLLAGAVLATAFWFFDALIGSLFLGQGDFLESAFAPDAHQVFTRVATLALLAFFFVVTNTIMARRRQTEAALRESESRFRLLFETAGSIILVLSPDYRILAFNQEAERVFGMDRGDALGRDYLELFVPEAERETVARDMEKVINGTPIRDFESTVVSRDEVTRHITWNVSRLVDGEGEPIGIVAAGQDVTERRAMLEQLHQAQKMEAIGQLTGGMAHDFNNLLFVIQGNLSLLEEQLKPESALRHPVDRAIAAVERGTILTQRLLAFSRKQLLRPMVIDVNAVVADITDLLQRTLGETVEVEVAPAEGLWRCVADRTQLENAILNLAINARDAMPAGGRLLIATANAGLDEEFAAADPEVTPGKYVTVSVTDTGTGMAPAVQRHIFEPFYTTKEAGVGSGLGLSMVYGFVKQSGGHVTVRSTEGAGTTVAMYLPRATARDTEATKAPVLRPCAPARGETILVVEDNSEVRHLAVAMLEDLGYRVTAAANGTEAMARLGQGPDVDLILTDVVLGGAMSGTDLAAAARERHPNIRTLYMSGYTDDAATHTGPPGTVARLLRKPFRKRDLMRIVRRTLEGGDT